MNNFKSKNLHFWKSGYSLRSYLEGKECASLIDGVVLQFPSYQEQSSTEKLFEEEFSCKVAV